MLAVPREAEPEGFGPAGRHDQRGGAVGGARGARGGARIPKGGLQLSGMRRAFIGNVLPSYILFYRICSVRNWIFEIFEYFE